MKLLIERDQLLNLLIAVTSVVERRQTLPILANVLILLEANTLTLVGTDLEVEASIEAEALKGSDGQCTVAARKLLDICRALPEQATVELETVDSRLKIRSGRSRFSLQTLAAVDFPRLETDNWEERVQLEQPVLRGLFEKTAFSMAQQDVRYFLNGVLLELDGTTMVAVATDGHRLARSRAVLPSPAGEHRQAIIPRKAVLELSRFLGDGGDEITIELNANHARFSRPGAVLTTKLIDGKFPDYKAVMSQVLSQKMVADRTLLHEVLARTSVLTNEKYRGVRLDLSKGSLKVSAHNPDQEEASDEIAVEYGGENLEIGFNVTYLMDALRAMPTEQIEAELEDVNSGCMLHVPGDEDTLYLIMPMRL
ncbi:MAG: DNA polymerase III subunit beta [Proteobacteria bacterium]|jgi:DNA polymerase-3 subunit beta|nr:DNA polymerase III subunit beta [Pseudomonadota bacterium]MDP6137219.1 DNA polymerase III subunit beta [Arenicellales bacterium]HCF72709.1 DNA polymerase III subunit beta [Gammaproteobacteria bacterium]MDP6392940.1 DNA polymerase III subunit beta [Arenicellales bacterium]MDP7219237.1 DNA polymerase III subunit beta [Arenicellales bacterium]|tara:strand:- start:244 stop:1344 length:1101 start_codon:yes stop_codon:yes gene_type:complete